MRYKTKPKQIEAFRLGMHDIPYWFLYEIACENVALIPFKDDKSIFPNKVDAKIKTPRGVLKAVHGDYVILDNNELSVMSYGRFEDLIESR